MSFKIVQTKEMGKKVLKIVPYLWEENNWIKWPSGGILLQQKRLALMQRDPNSVPKADWVLKKCSVKRRNLTYEAAVNECKKMSDNSHTERITTHSNDENAMAKLMRVQTQMELKMTKLETNQMQIISKLDLILSLIEKSSIAPSNMTTSFVLNLKPIDTIKDIDDLELNLTNKEFYQELVSCIAFYC